MSLGTDNWLRVGEAAKMAGVNVKTIHRYVDRGLVTAMRLPTGERRILESALRDKVTPSADTVTGSATNADARRIVERWIAELPAASQFNCDRIPVATLYELAAGLDRVGDLVASLRDEVVAGIAERET